MKITLEEKKKLKLSETEKAQLTKVEQIIQKIEFDGSSGIHNFSAIEEILIKSQRELKSFKEKYKEEQLTQRIFFFKIQIQ